jgi:hypothetical protein
MLLCKNNPARINPDRLSTWQMSSTRYTTSTWDQRNFASGPTESIVLAYRHDSPLEDDKAAIVFIILLQYPSVTPTSKRSFPLHDTVMVPPLIYSNSRLIGFLHVIAFNPVQSCTIIIRLLQFLASLHPISYVCGNSNLRRCPICIAIRDAILPPNLRICDGIFGEQKVCIRAVKHTLLDCYGQGRSEVGSADQPVAQVQRRHETQPLPTYWHCGVRSFISPLSGVVNS